MKRDQFVSTCFWFDTQAEEAARFYVSLFPNSEILNISRYGAGAPLPEGTALVVTFSLDGVEFMAMNGGPHFKLSEAASLVAHCDNQNEIDTLWSALIADGGAESQCGWLKDRFGLSWQIVPRALETWMTSSDKDATARVMAVVLQSVKLDIAACERAYAGD